LCAELWNTGCPKLQYFPLSTFFFVSVRDFFDKLFALFIFFSYLCGDFVCMCTYA